MIPPKLKGEKHPGAKLTNAQVRAIARALRGGKVASSKLARQYGVGETTIDKIRSGHQWSSVTGGKVQVKRLLTKAGELHSRVILTDRNVQEIRVALRDGHGLTELARKYRVHYTTIYDIREGRSWRHLKERLP